MTAPLLQVRALAVEFSRPSGFLRRSTSRAVDGVSFRIHQRETLALVGESGCGKTTIGRAILGLIPAASGHIEFDGQTLFSRDSQSTSGIGWSRAVRRGMQIVFQDPAGAMNPRHRVAEILSEPLEVHGLLPRSRGDSAKKAARADRIAQLLARVGLPPDAAARFPHEFSGGQRQRLVIARALATEPKLIVCDEPTSALDVSIQAQILNLLRDLQRDLGLSYLFITHDLAVVRQIADRVAVMREGRIVEEGQTDDIISHPHESYTRRLIDAAPRTPGPPMTLTPAPA